MNTRAVMAGVGMVAISAGFARAGLVQFEDPGIFSPTNNARIAVYWVGTDAGYTGELRWVDTAFESAPVTMYTNHAATPGESFTLPRVYSQGERVDFTYAVTVGGVDVFSTGVENDWSQFSTDASNPFDVVVGVEDIRFPGGDMDHNDAIFRVVFTETAVPAPGAFALLGGGCLVMLRRRR